MASWILGKEHFRQRNELETSLAGVCQAVGRSVKRPTGLEWSEQVQQVGMEVSPWYLIYYKNFSFYPECNMLNHSGFVSKMFGQRYMQRTVRILGCRQDFLLVVSCYKTEHKMHLSLQNCPGHYQMTFRAPIAVAQG